MSDAAEPTLVWFRRDLRLADHPALSAAAGRGPVVCLFVVDPAILARRHHRAPARLRFLRAGLEALDAELAERGVRLVVREGPPEVVVPAVAREAGAARVHATREVSPLGRARDERVAAALAGAGARLVVHHGDMLVEPEDLPGSAGRGYLVFTPFFRAWSEHPVPPRLPAPDRLEGPALRSDGLGALPAGDPLVPAGPAAARERLVRFIGSGAADAYDRRRDLMADDGTSRLSADLRFGMTSPAQVGRALGLPGPLTPGRAAFWRQVCWRDFYRHHLARHPEVARAALRPEMRAVRWDDDDALLGAWREGRTGYPIVDAAMRQLAAEGWVHNRARMVAASFLVKDLLVDWRRGETVFMQGLLDGDPANNNGGWQWVAGTGTDAAPYFRVFNPVLQGRRHDPAGAYVRRWVPELARVPAPRIHEPWRMSAAEQEAAGCRIGRDYPAPVVDHASRRAEAIARYEEARR
ncbi:MAG: DNA photolyase family protein [Thermoleophilia bacterium]|nr:DNA photolyase family protein [Thermoleophilia bacterium]